MRHVKYLAKLITWSMRNIIQLTITYKYSSASFVLVWGSRRSNSACPRLCSTTLHSMHCFWVDLEVGDLEGIVPMLKNGPSNIRVVCKTTMCLISKPGNFPSDPEKEASQPQQGKYCTYHLKMEQFSGVLLLIHSEAYVPNIILQCNKRRVKLDHCAQQ